MLRELSLEGESFGSYRQNGTHAVAAPGLDLRAEKFATTELSILAADARPLWRLGERLEHVLEAACAAFADQVAVADQMAVASDAQDVTFAALDARANAMARFLRGVGVKPGDRVAVLLDRGVQAYVTLFALLKARATYVPLDSNLPPDRLSFIAADAGVALVIAHRRFAANLERVAAPRIDLEDAQARIDACGDGPLTREESAGAENSICYILYTSGTTGQPKGVAIGHGSICNFVRVAAARYGFGPGDRVYQGMSIAFDFSIEELWVPLVAGATLVPNASAASLFGEELAEFLEERGVTCFCCVPTLLASIERDLPKIRVLLVGGEACPPALVKRWSRPGRSMLNSYGPTEATVTATLGQLTPGRPVTIGRPLPSYSVVILDAARDEAVPLGAAGELGIAGIGVAQGYLNRPELTQAKFIVDFLGLPHNPSGRIYRTGDLARVNAEGEIEFLGRIDTQVKIRGYRIELTEIESVLLEIPAIAQAVVAVHEPEPGGRELVAYYAVGHGAPAPERAAILGMLKARLPAYMAPAYLERLPFIPTLVSNKADRSKLPAPKSPRVQFAESAAAPQTDRERVLAKALGETLGLESVSIDGHFFDDYGAHSLLMARYCARVRLADPNLGVAMRDIYTHPTVRRLAAALEPFAPGEARARDAEPAHAPSNFSYYGCGALQLGFYALAGYSSVAAAVLSLEWTAAASERPLDLYVRCVAVVAAAFFGLNALAIAGKWLLIGKATPRTFPIWSLRYFRFWAAKFLARSAPATLFVGTPIFNVYLRLLGAKIGRHAVIASRDVPACADLFSVGDNAYVAAGAFLPGYAARGNRIRLGAIALGARAYVGESSVLDIDTAVGEFAQLGHASSLQAGQRVPDGKRYAGSPAQETSSNFRMREGAHCPSWRRAAYCAAQLAWLVAVAGAAPFVAVNFGLGLFGPRIRGAGLEAIAAPALGLSFLGVAASVTLGLALVYLATRLFAPFLREGRAYPLYGWRHGVQRAIDAFSNAPFLNLLCGDSAMIEPYLAFIGWRMGKAGNGGSNFGSEQRHDNPFLCVVGAGTIASDGLTMGNLAMTSDAFKVSTCKLGANNFVGTGVYVPANSRVGDNCLIASKAMVPIDGPMRENLGLLGSPAFEIPRAASRDVALVAAIVGDERARRVAAKARHNAVTALALLGVRWLVGFVWLFVLGAALAAYGAPNVGALALAGATAAAATSAIFLALERATLGFGRLSPALATVYDPYYWHIERHWKLSASPLSGMFAGTPMRNVLTRLMGVRIGVKVFDDGCIFTERTLVEVGDGANLGQGSVIQAHSLEEGVFKSDFVRIGAGCSVGASALVHYGVVMEEGSVLDPDSFLMKGESAPAGSHWRGNPAKLVG